METQKYLFSTRVGTSLRDTGAPSPTALVMKASGPDLGDGPVPEAPKVDADRLRRPSSPPTGLKPIADELRNMLPFGSPKLALRLTEAWWAARANEAKHGGDARRQVDPPHGGTSARAHRQGHWRDQSPLQLRRPNPNLPAHLADVLPPQQPHHHLGLPPRAPSLGEAGRPPQAARTVLPFRTPRHLPPGPQQVG